MYTKDEIIDRLKKAYSSYYDITEHDDKSDGLFMEAHFHVHSEQYFIMKKAQLFEMDSNEYTYFYYYPKLTLENFNFAVNDAYERGFPLIEPNITHRCSYVATIFVCDSYDEDALKALRSYRRRQSFQFSLHGWMEVHTALVDTSTENVVNNSDGRTCGKFLKNTLHPKKERRGLFILKNLL